MSSSYSKKWEFFFQKWQTSLLKMRDIIVLSKCLIKFFMKYRLFSNYYLIFCFFNQIPKKNSISFYELSLIVFRYVMTWQMKCHVITLCHRHLIVTSPPSLTWHWRVSDWTWWLDTPSTTILLNERELTVDNKMKLKNFSGRYLTEKEFLDNNLKMTYLLYMKKLI